MPSTVIGSRFAMLPKRIYEHRLPPIPFAVYCYLLCCDNKQNGCYPSKRTISNACGISGSSVGRAIKRLEATGLIKVNHNFGDGRQMNNSCEILPLNIPFCPTDFLLCVTER